MTNLLSRLKPNRIVIDADEAERLLKAAVKERGEGYVYQPTMDSGGSCLYVHQDERGNDVPGCLIGLALNKAGLPLDTLKAHNWVSIRTLSKSLPIEITSQALDVLTMAQMRQDQRRPWGEAVSRALEEKSYDQDR